MSERTTRQHTASRPETGRGLITARNDRWAWRRRIRASARAYRIYRIAVGVVGILLVLLGAATGWLPGPGGIPLVLAGLAVLASEFVWAQRLLLWAKERLQDGHAWLQRQPRWVSWMGGAATVAGISCAIWASLVVFGYPGWTPEVVSTFIGELPGVEVAR